MYVLMRQNRGDYRYCRDHRYVPTYEEVSPTGPFSTYLVWRMKMEKNAPKHPFSAWFFNPSFDIDVLTDGSLLLIYMHLWAKFLSVRFARYCSQNECNSQSCLQDENFRDIFKDYPIPLERMLSNYKQELIDAIE